MKLITAAVVILLSAWAAAGLLKCGKQAGGALCPNVQCCSLWGYCGDTADFCGDSSDYCDYADYCSDGRVHPYCQLNCWSDERSDHRCGSSFGKAPCGKSRCCSIWGYCGSNSSYCSGNNCQYRCNSGYSAGLDAALPANATAASVSDVITESLFEEMFPFQKECPSQGFYSYNAFLVAAESFPAFATVGDVATRKREVAAFLAHVAQATAEKGSELETPYKWGLCHINTTAYDANFCTSSNWPCAPGKKYSPRGAIQLSHNFNYGIAGQALGLDLIMEPELVASDPVVSFKTAMWFWMTRHENKPSYHDIVASGHKISGTSSIGFYKRYCDMMGVSYGYKPSSLIQMTVA